MLSCSVNVYLVMALIPGGAAASCDFTRRSEHFVYTGDLFDYLLGRVLLPEKEAIFYVSNVIAALAYLH